MARYRKIDPRIWNDAKFRALTDQGKLVFLFLLTHPHMTSLGAMRTTIPGLAAELNWPPKAFGKAFREALREGLIDFDENASCLVIPRFLKYNGPESPNVVTSWKHALDLIPECHLKDTLIQIVKAFTEALPEAFSKALPKAFTIAFPKGMPNQEQEQEQEPELEPEQKKEKRVPWYETFTLTEAMKTWCQTHTLPDPTKHLDEFLDHFRKTGGKMTSGQPVKDPQAAFRTWMRNTVKFSPQSVSTPTRTLRSAKDVFKAQDENT